MNGIELTDYMDQRIDVIEKVYLKALKLNYDIGMVSSFFKYSLDEVVKRNWDKLDEVQLNFYDFQLYLLDKKEYFEPSINELIEEVRKSLWTAIWNFKELQRMKHMGIGIDKLKPRFEKGSAAAALATQHIPELLAKMDAEYRKSMDL